MLMKFLTNLESSKKFPTSEIPNLWPMKIENLCSSWLDDKHLDGEMTVCLECHHHNCDQHDPELAIYERPWKHLMIDQNVNDKLEGLFEFLLQKYTSSWIENISYNKEIILFEFKELIRLATAAFVLRSKKHIKLNDFILTKIPGHLIQHLEMYVHGKRKARSAHFLEESVLKQYGNLMHPAVISADNELKYFKSIADLIIHTTLPPKHIKCDVSKSFLNEFISCCILSLVDILTDPDNINIILIYLLDNSKNQFANASFMETSVSAVKRVYFLHRFSPEYRAKVAGKYEKNYFGIKLKQIIEDEHLLFLFTRFAKEEYFLNHLQFFIHVDSFLSRLINPDLTQNQLKKLHESLKLIYELYFVEDSKDYIDFNNNDSIRQGFKDAIDGNFAKVEQFRNCKSLYEAYEYCNEILDYYVQKFFQTDVYLKLICGQRTSKMNIDSMNNQDCKTKNDEHFHSFEQSLRQTNNNCTIHHQYEKLGDIVDDEDVPSFNEDLTNWKVTIPRVISRTDDATNRENFYFEIHVQKSSQQNLVIERQFNEFYILESKLKEFHGDELNEISLPTRKSFLRITKQLLESHRQEFEEFLQQLLSNVLMKRSKLFCNFLNSSTDCFTGNFNLSKMIRNVPSRFSKEKGQHLYSFLKNFITSSEKDHPMVGCRNQQSPKKELNMETNNKRRKSFVTRWPELDLSITQHSNKLNKNHHASFEYLYDYVLAILIRFYKLNHRIKYLFFLIRPLFRQTLQVFCDYLLCRKLKQTFTPHVIVEIIDYLKNSLNYEESNKLKKQFPMNLSKNQRSELALKLFKELMPKWLLELFVDYNKHEEIIFLIFSLLQYRLLNKQLLYLILDLLIAELFPKILLDTIDHRLYN